MNINNVKLLMFGGRREFTSRRAELKKGRKALFQHPDKDNRKSSFAVSIIEIQQNRRFATGLEKFQPWGEACAQTA